MQEVINGLSKRNKLIKRIFDLVFSIVLLIILLPFIFLLILFSIIDTKEFGLYFQKRVGFRGQLFSIVKIKTLKSDGQATIFGKFLNDSKLNELPQLFNILIGDMSFVGPRPDIVGFANELKGEDRIILSVRPGITGPATLKFLDEERDLLASLEPEKLANLIWLDKVELNKIYINNYSFHKDIAYLFKTILLVTKKFIHNNVFNN